MAEPALDEMARPIVLALPKFTGWDGGQLQLLQVTEDWKLEE